MKVRLGCFRMVRMCRGFVVSTIADTPKHLALVMVVVTLSREYSLGMVHVLCIYSLNKKLLGVGEGVLSMELNHMLRRNSTKLLPQCRTHSVNFTGF